MSCDRNKLPNSGFAQVMYEMLSATERGKRIVGSALMSDQLCLHCTFHGMITQGRR